MRTRSWVRFMSKVDQTETCWIWTGYRDPNGYGRFYAGEHQPSALAHRWLFIALRGPIAQDLPLDHLCRVPACVNPFHLEPVTTRENVKRGLAGDLRTHCANGHEFTAENTYRRPDGRKYCRECHRVTERRRGKRPETLARRRDRYRRSVGEPK